MYVVSSAKMAVYDLNFDLELAKLLTQQREALTLLQYESGTLECLVWVSKTANNSS